MMLECDETAGNDPRFRHFIEAQESTYARAVAELARGEKRSHWMWFIFPQLAGLGSSAMAHRYALGSLQEAVEYLAHPVLGMRLQEVTGVVLAVEGRTVSQMFGYPDDLKFHSSMTLFALAAERVGGPTVYREALDRYFGGALDEQTRKRLVG